MSHLAALKGSTTLHDVAALLGYKPASLAYLLYKKSDAAKYRQFDIPKSSGGFRRICAPAPELKLLQQRLGLILQNCAEEIADLAGYGDTSDTPDRIVHGFKRRRSIITNARQHRHRRYVFNVDLENFFGSINFGRVRGYFMKDNRFALRAEVATIIAKIACFDNSLPQGSPCSPIISNLIGHILDVQLVRLAARSHCVYSRYADDISFSTNELEFPPTIATCVSVEPHRWVPAEQLRMVVQRCGFSINQAKTRMQYRNSRQEVTGLVVNEKVNVRQEYAHKVRAMAHRLFRTGSFSFERAVIDAAGIKTRQSIPGRLAQLHGMLGFIHSTHVASAEPSAKANKEAIYRRFLLFKEFYSAALPVVVCEGKTDNVYITHSIRGLAPAYPKLATVDSKGEIALRIRRFRYSATSTGRLLRLRGGTGDLAGVIQAYRSEVERFAAPGMHNPVILVIDNDSGAKSIYNVIKDITGSKPSGKEPFVHVVANLYVAPIPLAGGASESIIEDLFDVVTKGTLLNGKPFDPSNGYNKDTHYGKADFAYKVVEPNADTIDFSGFAGLLDNLVAVIDTHARRFPAPTP